MWVATMAPAPLASSRDSASPGSSWSVHGSHSAKIGVSPFQAAAWAVAGRIRCWPSGTPLALHAWLCDCGEYGVTGSQPESQRAVEAHLAQTKHAYGEYYYGCQGQRTTVTVTPGPSGRFSHELTSR